MTVMAMQPLMLEWVAAAGGPVVAKATFQVLFLMYLMISLVVVVVASAPAAVMIYATTCALTWKRPF